MSFVVLLLAILVEKLSGLRQRLQRDGGWLHELHKLESGSVPLSESMALWERGEELAAICQGWLDGAKAKIEAARPKADG